MPQNYTCYVCLIDSPHIFLMLFTDGTDKKKKYQRGEALIPMGQPIPQPEPVSYREFRLTNSLSPSYLGRNVDIKANDAVGALAQKITDSGKRCSEWHPIDCPVTVVGNGRMAQ